MKLYRWLFRVVINYNIICNGNNDNSYIRILHIKVIFIVPNRTYIYDLRGLNHSFVV